MFAGAIEARIRSHDGDVHGNRNPHGPCADAAPEARAGSTRYPLFDLIRLGAALLVIFSHAFTTTGRHEPQPIQFGTLGVTWGHIGVAIFFVTSGFLVAESWRRQPQARRYLLKRVLRIWPAFLVVIALSVFVIGPLVTTASLRTYFTDYHSWAYLLHNAVMSPIVFTLPGVFRHQPLSGVNGSFWTLPYEVLAYLGLLLLAITRMMRTWLLAILLVVGLVFYHLVVANPIVHLHQQWNGLWLQNGIRLGVWFLAGALAAQLRHRILGRHLSALAALAVAVFGIATHQAVVAIPALAFLVIYTGTLPCRPAGLLHRLGDPSYGMYLYGFLIQQLLVETGLVHAATLALVRRGGSVGDGGRLPVVAPDREAGHAVDPRPRSRSAGRAARTRSSRRRG